MSQRVFTIANGRSEAVQVNSIQLMVGTHFSVIPPALPAIIAAHETLDFTVVSFSNNEDGDFTDQVQVFLGGVTDPIIKNLSVTFVSPPPALLDFTIEFFIGSDWIAAAYDGTTDFGTLAAAMASLEIPARVKNIGNTEAIFTFYYGGTPYYAFSLTYQEQFTLQPNDTREFTVTFNNPSIGNPAVYEDGDLEFVAAGDDQTLSKPTRFLIETV